MAMLPHLAALPDAPSDHVDAATLGDAIDANGAMIVRALVSAEDVLALDYAFGKAIAACEANEQGDWFSPYDDGTSALVAGRAWLHSFDCALMADSPAMLDCLFDVYRRSGVIDLVSAYLGETPVLSSQKSTLRRALGNKVYLENWHQDGAFLGAGTRVVNVWLALTACGEHAASLEIAVRRQTGIVPTGGDGALFDWSVGAKDAAKASPVSVTPVCSPGDAIVFDHLCLHRTSLNAAYTEERRALETWFFASSTYPYEYDPRPIRL